MSTDSNLSLTESVKFSLCSDGVVVVVVVVVVGLSL